MTKIVDFRQLREGDVFRFRDGTGGECINRPVQGSNGQWGFEWVDDGGLVQGDWIRDDVKLAVTITRPRNEEFERELAELVNGPPQHSSAIDRLIDKHTEVD